MPGRGGSAEPSRPLDRLWAGARLGFLGRCSWLNRQMYCSTRKRMKAVLITCCCCTTLPLPKDSWCSQEEKYLHDQCSNISRNHTDRAMESVMGTRPFIPICQQWPIKISILAARVSGSNIIDCAELLRALSSASHKDTVLLSAYQVNTLQLQETEKINLNIIF